MTSKAAIDEFFSQPVLAVAGVSRDPRKFGNAAFRELKAKGYRLLPINPNTQAIEGAPCYPSLKALPEKVGGLLVCTPPAVTEGLVREAAEAGISRVWMQAGSESQGAIQFCRENGIDVISGECILMYQHNPAFMHKFHKFFKETFGGKPN